VNQATNILALISDLYEQINKLGAENIELRQLLSQQNQPSAEN